MRKPLLLAAGLFFLLAAEILKVYFIMPFPGSQQSNTIGIAYFIHRYIWLLRIAGWAVVILPLLHYLRNGRWWQKGILGIVLVVYALVVYAFNFKFLADKMFYQPQTKLFAAASGDSINKNELVIGVAINGRAKAYPIEIIGYHHQVKDTVGNTPVMVTYCTVCRTGRVYSPFVNGKYELFRLVGMDHFNAMFEDATTKSWWRQESGTAITGKLKGTQLPEIPSRQMRLGDWLHLYPNSLVLLPDTTFNKQYDDLKGYDIDTLHSSLEKRDSASWAFKSWVIGVDIKGNAKAYDWNVLAAKKLMEDSLAGVPLLLTMEDNGQTFYALNRAPGGRVLHFEADTTVKGVGTLLADKETKSVWRLNGVCIFGPLKDSTLQPVQTYQEFWHSWQTFHPGTKKGE